MALGTAITIQDESLDAPSFIEHYKQVICYAHSIREIQRYSLVAVFGMGHDNTCEILLPEELPEGELPFMI